MMPISRITKAELETLYNEFRSLIGVQFTNLTLPKVALQSIEPSQIGTIVGVLMDALIPHLDDVLSIGLTKHSGSLRDREGYPDYIHTSNFRLELKLLYIDNPGLQIKRPSTPREPSARLTQKVTIKNVDVARDAMLLIAYQLEDHRDDSTGVSPTIVDYEVFSMIELIEARDKRLDEGGGRWFGNYETPTILSKIGRQKMRRNEALNVSSYGRKESEGKDYNEDTNFGKLRRIPHRGLQTFLAKYRVDAKSPVSTQPTLLDLEDVDSQ